MTQTVLIVDDEPAIRDMIAISLEMADFRVIEADNAQKGLTKAVDERPDIILLDWMMPGTSGVELARRLKREDTTRETPIILLTAKGEEDNKVHGLDAGADDYITKPFSPRELIARMRAVLRRSTPASQNLLEVDGLVVDVDSKRVSIDGAPIDMGPTEYRLLVFFMSHPERAYSRAQLLDQVWGASVYVEERTVDVHIRRLRKALGDRHEYLIQTVRGTGYRFSHQRSRVV